MGLLDRLRSWWAERTKREAEELAAMERGEVHSPRDVRRDLRPPGVPEENPFGTSGSGFYGPRSDFD
jgi:hypothetical protein